MIGVADALRLRSTIQTAANVASASSTTGVGPDLFVDAQNAVRAMIDHITDVSSLSREDAYLLCSLCVDLKISEVVDAGEWIVRAVNVAPYDLLHLAHRQTTMERYWEQWLETQ